MSQSPASQPAKPASYAIGDKVRVPAYKHPGYVGTVIDAIDGGTMVRVAYIDTSYLGPYPMRRWIRASELSPVAR